MAERVEWQAGEEKITDGCPLFTFASVFLGHGVPAFV